MQYQVVYASEIYLSEATSKIKKEIQSLCQEGWKPQGGISVSVRAHDYSSDTYYLCQAMIKED